MDHLFPAVILNALPSMFSSAGLTNASWDGRVSDYDSRVQIICFKNSCMGSCTLNVIQLELNANSK